MVGERIGGFVAELPLDDAMLMSELSTENQIAATLFAGGANVLLAWFWSRQMEGTVNKFPQKILLSIGCAGITAANVVINTQIWT